MKINEAAVMTGVSVRTLHHYDDIGLISPERSVSNDYREYTEADLDRLQQVLFFKKLGFKLSHIKEILSQPDYSQEETLAMQREMLQREKEQISVMIETIDLTIENLKGAIEMNNADKFKGIDFSSNPYEQEARTRWGDEAVEAAGKNLGRMGSEKAKERFAQIYSLLADIRHMDPASDEAQAGIEEWYHFLNETGDYTPEMSKGLGEIYVADERFKKNIDQYGDGLAEFMREAMTEYYNQKK